MYTQCPECHKTSTLTAAQLREGRGLFICKHCSAKFDALQTLSDAATESRIPIENDVAWKQTSAKPSLKLWPPALMLNILLFCTQLIYFEAPHFIQNKTFRPWLIQSCQLLQCQLPDYRNLHDFSVLHSSLTQAGDQNYVFQAVVNNGADFVQLYPDLKLTLLKLNGDALAERIFKPVDYVPSEENAYLAVNQTFEINLAIARTPEVIGGFTLELI